MLIPRTLILSDGSLPSLLACVACREELVAAESASAGVTASGSPPVVVPFAFRLFGDDARTARIASQAADLGLGFVDEPAITLGGLRVSAGQREAHELIASAYLAAALGCERVIWPVTASVGDTVDLDRMAEVTDRSLIAARVAALDRLVKCPALAIETPYVDYTDVQIAEAALDLDVPVDAMWHQNLAGQDAEQDRRRWGAALRAAGYRIAGAV